MAKLGLLVLGLAAGALAGCAGGGDPPACTPSATGGESSIGGAGGVGGVGGQTTTSSDGGHGGAGGAAAVGGLCADYIACSNPCGAEDLGCIYRCYYASSFECRVCNDRYTACLMDNGCLDSSGNVDMTCFNEHCYPAYDLCYVGTVQPSCEDADGDGFGLFCPAGPDCDDTRASIHPGQVESCNGADDDCDGVVDDKMVGCTKQRKWAVLLYMAGDNNLGDSALAEIEQLALSGGTDGNVGVALQVELGAQQSFYDQILPPEVFERTWRMIVPSSGRPDLGAMFGHASSIGDVDITRPEALSDFLEWGRQVMPADHTMVIIWDHGGGWSGALEDEGSFAFMSMPDLRAGFEGSSLRPEVIAFSACLMGSAEVLTELQGLTDYVVASEEVSAGMPSPQMVRALHQQPQTSPVDAALTLQAATKHQAEGYAMSYTIGTYDMAGVPALVSALEALGAKLTTDMAGLHDAIAAHLPAVQSMAFASARDLADLGHELTGVGDAELDSRLAAAVTASTSPELIVRFDSATSAHPDPWTPSLADAHGVSIFLPRPADTDAAEVAAYGLLRSSQIDPGWDGLVGAWLGNAALGVTQGDFHVGLGWTVSSGQPQDADLDLFIYEPHVGWGAPYLGAPLDGTFSDDSLQSGEAAESFDASSSVGAGSYLVFVRYQDNGLSGTTAEATVDFTDQRFNGNDTTLHGTLSLEHPCATGEGWLGGDIVNGACSDIWFVGKLVRDDDRHTLMPGLYSDFGLRGRKLRLLPRP